MHKDADALSLEMVSFFLRFVKCEFLSQPSITAVPLTDFAFGHIYLGFLSFHRPLCWDQYVFNIFDFFAFYSMNWPVGCCRLVEQFLPISFWKDVLS